MPTKLICSVENSGDGEARDARLTFIGALPVGTKIWAEPEFGIEMFLPESLPNPYLELDMAKIQTALLVLIPRIAPKDKVEFYVATTDADNVKTGIQILKIRSIIFEILSKFDARLKATYPNEAKKWNKELVIKARIKEENMFTPGKLSYEKGREPITYFTKGEVEASKVNQELYARYKKEFIDIYQGQDRLSAPVTKINTVDGSAGMLASFPPYIPSCLTEMEYKRFTIPEAYVFKFIPRVPESYDDVTCISKDELLNKIQPIVGIPGETKQAITDDKTLFGELNSKGETL